MAISPLINFPGTDTQLHLCSYPESWTVGARRALLLQSPGCSQRVTHTCFHTGLYTCSLFVYTFVIYPTEMISYSKAGSQYLNLSYPQSPKYEDLTSYFFSFCLATEKWTFLLDLQNVSGSHGDMGRAGDTVLILMKWHIFLERQELYTGNRGSAD